MNTILPVSLLLSLLGCSGDKTSETPQDTATDPVVVDTDDTDDTDDTGGDTGDTGEDCEPTAEVCDGVDNDCDGDIDEDAEDAATFYTDGDADGYGDPAQVQSACEAPDGTVSDDTDCDDTDTDIRPDAPEVCDGIDNDCDGDTDEDDADDAVTWYADVDGDGYGDEDTSAVACAQPKDYTASDDDCDDDRADINPGADEVCDEPTDYNCDGSIGYADADGDGWAACVDCVDTDADINPDATEVCDGVDNDCSGTIDGADADDAITYYADTDGDGYGDPSSTTPDCTVPAGYADNAEDCDDTDADSSPDGEEVCDEADNDCDGDIDEGASDFATFYADDDGDGYGDPDSTEAACEASSGYLTDDSDCDDTDADISPDGEEVCDGADNDCDGSTDGADASDATTYYIDDDGDGYGDASSTALGCEAPTGYADNTEDCDDTDADISPAGAEVCDELDNDCDGDTDEDAVDAQRFFADADSDGYGDPDTTTTGCEAPSGYLTDDADCDDTDATVSPDAEEVCDSIDNDCDGSTDEGTATDADTWYRDLDGDGYGDPDATDRACEQPSGFVSDDADCDDTDADQSPDADEVCNGEDDDCDGDTDEAGALEPLTFYADDDGDGFGDLDATTESCDAPTGYVSDSTDCDDTDATVSPDADEVCNSTDDDCDGDTDEDPTDGTSYYADDDADGYGDPSDPVSACDAPTGYLTDATDCDDTSDDIHPGADEVCNSTDDDCDGDTDEDPTDGTSYYADADADGYGDAADSTSACDAPTGYLTDATDCDDTSSDIHPGADEYCNSVDDDCDGDTDEDSALDVLTYYADVDGDGYGDAGDTADACSAPSGHVSDATDCDDDDDSTWPGASEVCGDGVINDCDGTLDVAFETCGVSGDLDLVDADSLLYGEDGTDYAGYAVSNAGDVNGDGFDDILIGAYGDEEGGADAGSAYLVLGLGLGSLSGADAHFIGEDASDYAGSALSGAGDLDGDGYDDLLIGAYGDDDGSSDAGAVYIVFGGVTGDLDLSAADIKLTGEDSGDYAGYAVAGAGDVDGDGLADLIIGAHRDEDGGTSSGSAYLIFGGITASTSLSGADVQLVGESNSDYAGYSVGGAGDVDGDGLDDVLIGATGEDTDGSAAGAVYVVLGGVSADLDLSAADHKITGEDTGDWVGCSVDGAGDVDGDGLSDILIGACQDEVGGSYSGSVYVVLGGLSGTVSVVDAHAELIGESGTDYAGESVSGAGDVDGDGLADFLIGARGDDDNGSNSGAAYLMLGGVSGYLDLSRADAKLAGEGGSDYAGGAVSGGGDVDGDGLADILVGAYGEGTGGSAAGGVYVVLGGGY
ncbi:MAG: hypothetical protein ACI8RZ_001130 [Myxococcota bacterium]|jgi:hypothetical protein